MSNIRHVSFTSRFQINVTATPNTYVETQIPIGCVSIPLNKIYKINNIDFKYFPTLTNSIPAGLSRVDLHHRFYTSSNPLLEYENYGNLLPNNLISKTDLIFNDFTDRSFQSGANWINIKTSKGDLSFTAINTQVKHQCILPLSSIFYQKIENFHFDSKTDNLFCFSFFPVTNFTPTTGQTYYLDYLYSINFDLIEG